MAETVRVAVAIATPEGVWLLPREDEDGEFDAALPEDTADPALGWDERERVALEVVHARFSRFVAGFELYGVSAFRTPDGEVSVYCAFSDVLEAPLDTALERIDADEIPHLAASTRDPAVTIALQLVELHGRRGEPNSPFSAPIGPPSPEHGLALLHEQPTPDRTRWSATFSCRVTSEQKTLRGPTAATADEAVAWGRAHAHNVLLFVGDRVGRPYNAGSESVDDPHTGEPWPPVPPLTDLGERPIRPQDVVHYVPLDPAGDEPTAG